MSRGEEERLLMDISSSPPGEGERNFCRVFPDEEIRGVRVANWRAVSPPLPVVRVRCASSVRGIFRCGSYETKAPGNNEAKSREHVVTGVMEPSQVPFDSYSPKKSLSPMKRYSRPSRVDTGWIAEPSCFFRIINSIIYEYMITEGDI